MARSKAIFYSGELWVDTAADNLGKSGRTGYLPVLPQEKLL
jgi:hypothetical protein